MDHTESLNAEACLRLGMALDELGRSAHAEEAYRRAITMDPRQTSTLVNLGWILLLQGQVEEAIRLFEEALDLGPHSVAQFNLGLAWLSLEDFPRAEAAYAFGVERYARDDAVRIGAVADLEDLAQSQGPEGPARILLERFWTTPLRKLQCDH